MYSGPAPDGSSTDGQWPMAWGDLVPECTGERGCFVETSGYFGDPNGIPPAPDRPEWTEGLPYEPVVPADQISPLPWAPDGGNPLTLGLDEAAATAVPAALEPLPVVYTTPSEVRQPLPAPDFFLAVPPAAPVASTSLLEASLPPLATAATSALQPLTDTGNVGFSYSDSSLNVWLKDRSSAKLREAAEIMEDLPDVTAVWRRDGSHFDRVSPVRRDRMTGPENAWFSRKAQELVDTQAAPYGPDLVATLRDNTTYSVAGDHGGIQRASQQIPIVFAGGGVSHKDLQAEVRSIDIMPTILRTMGIKLEKKVDGKGYELPMAKD